MACTRPKSSLPTSASASERSGRTASWYRPGFVILDAPNGLLRGVQREAGNGSSTRDLHRVAILDTFDPEDPYGLAIIGGRLRHEIEHAIQWDRGGRECLW